MKSLFESDRGGAPVVFIPNPLLGGDATAFQPAESSGLVTAGDLEERIAQAFEEGRQAGRAELPWREEAELTRTVETLKVALDAVDQMASHLLLAEREAIVSLATAMAEHLVGQVVASDPDRLAVAVREGLELVDSVDAAVVALAPSDFERIQDSEDSNLRSLVETHRAHLVASESVAEGGARVEAGEGRVVIDLRESLARMAEELRELSTMSPGVEPATAEVSG